MSKRKDSRHRSGRSPDLRARTRTHRPRSGRQKKIGASEPEADMRAGRWWQPAFSPQLVPDVLNELASKALDIRSPSYSSASIAKRGDRERSLVEEHRNDFAA